MRKVAVALFLLIVSNVFLVQTAIPPNVPATDPPISNAIPSDTLSFSSYIGGSDDDTIHCVVVDDEGYVYIAGITASNNLPSNGGPKFPFAGFYDCYVMKLTNESQLVYTAYLGGTSVDGNPDLHPDAGCWIDVDDAGRVYMTGYTESSDFPNVNAWDTSYGGSGDCFALRLSPSGDTIEYATYLGGDGLDMGTTIAVDDLGNAYITGRTESFNFPTQAAFDDSLGGSRDNFLLKLDSSGQLNYSTFVGGGLGEHSHPGGLVVDGDGTAYIIGDTQSSDFPTINAYDDSLNGIATDVFFSKVNSTGHLLASSFFGGSASDENGAIAIDQAGNIYISGNGSGDFPKTEILSSNPRIFIAKFDNSGQDLIYSTAFGSGGPYGLTVDDEGCAFVTGRTYSIDFPMVNPYDDARGGWSDSFLVKLASGGDQILYSSYIGGSSEEIGLSLTKTATGSIYLAGVTNSIDFPLASPLVPTNQKIDGFLIRLEDSWPDIPQESTSTTSPTTSTSSNPVTTTNPSGGSSYELALLLSFGIGIEIVVILVLMQRRTKHSRND